MGRHPAQQHGLQLEVHVWMRALALCSSPADSGPGLRAESRRALPCALPAVASVTGPSALHPAPQLCTRPAGSGGLLPYGPFLDGRPPRELTCPGWPGSCRPGFRTRSSARSLRPGRGVGTACSCAEAPEGVLVKLTFWLDPRLDPQVLSGAQRPPPLAPSGLGPQRSRACIPRCWSQGFPCSSCGDLSPGAAGRYHSRSWGSCRR